MPVLQLHRHKTKRAVLVSPSRDGDLLSTWLHKLDYEVLRGSARDKNISSAIAMLRKLRLGYSLGFGIDGPKGPIYTVKPGMTYLAQKTQVTIIPVGSAYSKKFIFQRAWDKYQLPLPFAKAVLYLGEPIAIPHDADLNTENVQLQNSIQQAELLAEQYLAANS